MAEAERLLRKELRLKLGSQKELLLVDTPYTRLAQALCTRILQERPQVRIVETMERGAFMPVTLESYVVAGLRDYLEDRGPLPARPPLMETIPEALLAKEAENLSLPFPSTNNDARALLEQLQKAQPQTKTALRKSLSCLAMPAAELPEEIKRGE